MDINIEVDRDIPATRFPRQTKSRDKVMGQSRTKGDTEKQDNFVNAMNCTNTFTESLKL